MQHVDARQRYAPPRWCAAPLALLIGFVLAAPAALAQGGTTRAGMLTCRTSASIGLLVGSRQRLACQYKGNDGFIQNYTGTIGRLGLDVGITAGGVKLWAVLAGTNYNPSGALAGEFFGASGDISVGLGVGANLLVGGTGKSVSLQPLSVEGQVGVNLALGVARMKLTPTR